MAEKNPKPTGNQCALIRRRGLDPNNYVVLKETYSSLWLKDLRFNKVKILYKRN